MGFPAAGTDSGEFRPIDPMRSCIGCSSGTRPELSFFVQCSNDVKRDGAPELNKFKGFAVWTLPNYTVKLWVITKCGQIPWRYPNGMQAVTSDD